MDEQAAAAPLLLERMKHADRRSRHDVLVVEVRGDADDAPVARIDQQITVQQAFAGPLRIKQRAGTLDPKTLARTDLEPVFKEKPAVHRFPGSMATRVQDLAASARRRGASASWSSAPSRCRRTRA